MSVRRMVRCLRPSFLAIPLFLGATVPVAAAQEPGVAVAAPAHGDLFATVNGKAIPLRDYETAFAAVVRQKFYHGQVPEAQLQEAREEVKSKVIQKVLLLEEAERRGIEPDAKEIDEAIAGYDRQYATSAVWKERRESVLPELRKQLSDQNKLTRLEQAVRQIPEPADAEVKAFYDSKPELFTEPEKLKISAILLAVDPSSPVTAWQSAREEAAGIYKRLQAGGSFEDAARLHSNGKFADEGGDMGYLHRGMLPEALQERLDSFELGKVNPPMDTLEGVALFRLDDRLPPKKREFADVAQRAKDLLMRERQEQAWKGLVDRLMASANIKVHHQLNSASKENKGS